MVLLKLVSLSVFVFSTHFAFSIEYIRAELSAPPGDEHGTHVPVQDTLTGLAAESGAVDEQHKDVSPWAGGPTHKILCRSVSNRANKVH